MGAINQPCRTRFLITRGTIRLRPPRDPFLKGAVPAAVGPPEPSLTGQEGRGRTPRDSGVAPTGAASPPGASEPARWTEEEPRGHVWSSGGRRVRAQRAAGRGTGRGCPRSPERGTARPVQLGGDSPLLLGVRLPAERCPDGSSLGDRRQRRAPRPTPRLRGSHHDPSGAARSRRRASAVCAGQGAPSCPRSGPRRRGRCSRPRSGPRRLRLARAWGRAWALALWRTPSDELEAGTAARAGGFVPSCPRGQGPRGERLVLVRTKGPTLGCPGPSRGVQ